MPKYFHYTTVDHIPEIKNDGFLKLVESNVSLSEPNKGPDVVWLLSEPLESVPKMLLSRLMRNGKWTGYVKSKAEVELEITLEKSEVTRADKFLKKHGASEEEMEALEASGGFRLNKQYVTVEQIPVGKITKVTDRPDLVNLVGRYQQPNR
jgi:hypothetical protein